jgi:signal transduction histidine kinase
MFFSSIAHELRTPLNSIIPLSINLLKYITNDRGHLILKIITNSAIHLSHIIEDALDMSRIENNRFDVLNERFDIRSSVQEVSDIMEFQLQ